MTVIHNVTEETVRSISIDLEDLGVHLLLGTHSVLYDDTETFDAAVALRNALQAYGRKRYSTDPLSP